METVNNNNTVKQYGMGNVKQKYKGRNNIQAVTDPHTKRLIYYMSCISISLTFC